MKKVLGTFEIESGEIRVSDPCYEKESKSGISFKAKKGTWTAHINLNDEDRVASLVVVFKGKREKAGWTLVGDGGVDSGQMSIFDKSHFRKEGDKDKITSCWSGWEKKDEPDGGGFFYATCCSLTCGDDNGAKSKGGVLAHGAVSQTGYGDGGYPVQVKYNAEGEAVAVRVRFL